MTTNKKYYLTIQHLLTQRRNKKMTPNYNFIRLTMTEVESHLYTEDENSTNISRAYETKTFNSTRNNDKFSKEKYEKRQKYRWENKLCFFCGLPDHQKKDCIKWQTYKKKKEKKVSFRENVNSMKEIVLHGNNLTSQNLSMARLGNAGHLRKQENIDILLVHDLNNWVMDSGATCHMTPYKNDFVNDSKNSEDKVVEVVDGYTVPAKSSGTIIIKTTSNQGDSINLRIKGVLHVPHLSRRLFSLMSIIKEGHDVTLSKSHGIKFTFGPYISITIPLPNYKLFASPAIQQNVNRKHNIKKTKIPLKIIYNRLGLRSVKMLLSANQDNVWNDTEIILENDFVSTSDHVIATIEKRARNKIKEPDATLQPGQTICLDLIKSPSKISLTTETSFPFYLLAVDAFS